MAECDGYPFAAGYVRQREARNLLRRELTEHHFIHQAKRSSLLNLAAMKRRSRNVKTRVFRNLNQTQFRGIESDFGLLKSESHRLVCGRFSRSPDAIA